MEPRHDGSLVLRRPGEGTEDRQVRGAVGTDAELGVDGKLFDRGGDIADGDGGEVYERGVVFADQRQDGRLEGCWQSSQRFG
jgi:hypothetical protein